jgi:hypothetical protein
MSSPTPFPPANHAGPKQTTPGGAHELDTFLSGLTEQDTAAIDAGRAGPPAEVLEQMAAADLVARRLRERGRRVGFSATAPGVRACVELLDLDGNAIARLSVAEAAQIAVGAQVDRGV